MMDKWRGYEFESSAWKTTEFKSFALQYRNAIRKLLGPMFETCNVSTGHFYVSGFARNKESGKFIYFNSGDVRGRQDEWYTSILIRTATSEKDYTGGVNWYSSLPDLAYRAGLLTRSTN